MECIHKASRATVILVISNNRVVANIDSSLLANPLDLLNDGVLHLCLEPRVVHVPEMQDNCGVPDKDSLLQQGDGVLQAGAPVADDADNGIVVNGILDDTVVDHAPALVLQAGVDHEVDVVLLTLGHEHNVLVAHPPVEIRLELVEPGHIAGAGGTRPL